MRYLTIILLLIITHTQAQVKEEALISGTFSNLQATEFILQLEAQTSYRFYYKGSDLDTLKVDITVDKKTLTEVLGLAFKNTDLKYAINGSNVFLSKNKAVETRLPDGFLSNNNSVSEIYKPEAANPLAVDDKVINATLENKLYTIGIKTGSSTGMATLSGTIRNIKTGEPLAGASVYIESPRSGTTADQFGYYSLSIPKGQHVLYIKGSGMKERKHQIIVHSDGKFNVELQEQVLALKEVIVSSERAANVTRVQLGVEKLTIKNIKQIPAVFGEADVIKAVLTLPGVKSVGEASSGFNVRGGSTDQNLILFNDATIYNPSHFFGFFSAFNPEVVKDIELYKSSIPSRFGGRLSSVLDIHTREGNKKEFSGSAGIGLLTSRLNIEGPIVQDRTSLILGGRTTYSNWMLDLLPGQYNNSRASFYDLNFGINHIVNEKNTLFLTTYLSNDKFSLNKDTTSYAYNNKNVSLKWRHVFSNKLNAVFTTGKDFYGYNISGNEIPTISYKLDFNVNQSNFKSDFTWYLNPRHTIDLGFGSIYYKLNPGNFQPLNEASLTKPDRLDAQQALESAVYIGDRFDVNQKLSLNYGVRYSLYNYLGPQQVNTYISGSPREESSITGVKTYDKGEFIKNYQGPEFRLSGRYSINDDLSVKAGYNTLRQYIHLLSNTTSIAPTDIWRLSDPNIRPQFGDQVSIGIYKNLKSNSIETSVEVYYKRLQDFLDYKSGASLIMNHNIETEVLNTRGKAYGAEFMIRKSAGKMNGWLSYTYSRTLLQMDDELGGQQINGGRYYPANYDKPHDLSLIGNYRFSHRFSISVNALYSTGRPITLPISKYMYAGSQRVLYSDRNAYRIPDYFRTDFSMNIEGNHKVRQLTHNSWTIGIYNITGRNNAYSTYFTSEGGAIRGYQLSIFASAMPFVNYNIRF
ncbi:MAG: carboxypeptidase-like regulatory domain-containing protein [Daejeonella sp.]|uniref:TonB-dependent receptor n=1 Tax=Daejeonella sp. TaxID=2805397 RepID=UPI003C7197EA